MLNSSVATTLTSTQRVSRIQIINGSTAAFPTTKN